jgi:Holliday junction DNA helicase RuvB
LNRTRRRTSSRSSPVLLDFFAASLRRRPRATSPSALGEPPRHANRFLTLVRDFALYRAGGGAWNGDGEPLLLTLDVVKEALRRLGIDDDGLDRTDRRILEVLVASENPVGLKTVSVAVGEEEGTIGDVYEPYLIQLGLLVKTSRGRSATDLAVERGTGGNRQPISHSKFRPGARRSGQR